MKGGARIVDIPLFRFLVDVEVTKAQRLGYCVSVLCITADMAQGEIPGTPAALADMVAPQLRGTDAVTAWGSGSIALLLVDVDAPSLPALVHRLTVDLEAIAWNAGGASYPRTATIAEGLLRQAVAMMVEAKRGGQSRLVIGS